MSRHDIKDALLNNILNDEIADKHIPSSLVAKLCTIPNDHKRRRTDSKKTFSINGIKFTAKFISTNKYSKYLPGIWGIVLSNDKDHVSIVVNEFISYDGGFDIESPKASNTWRMFSMLDKSMSNNVVQTQSTPHIAGAFEKTAIEGLCKQLESGTVDKKNIRIIDPGKKLNL
jgi:hypothetical protein